MRYNPEGTTFSLSPALQSLLCMPSYWSVTKSVNEEVETFERFRNEELQGDHWHSVATKCSCVCLFLRLGQHRKNGLMVFTEVHREPLHRQLFSLCF